MIQNFPAGYVSSVKNPIAALQVLQYLRAQKIMGVRNNTDLHFSYPLSQQFQKLQTYHSTQIQLNPVCQICIENTGQQLTGIADLTSGIFCQQISRQLEVIGVTL